MTFLHLYLHVYVHGKLQWEVGCLIFIPHEWRELNFYFKCIHVHGLTKYVDKGGF